MTSSLSLPDFAAPCFDGRVLRSLLVGDRNVIHPWGVEFADSSAFFSLEDGVGYRYQLLESNESIGPHGQDITQVLRLQEGLVRLSLSEHLVGPKEFRRACTLTCLEDTTLMDFVLRYRFQSSVFPIGHIAGLQLPFVRSCVYHQYAVGSAAVTNDNYSISVSVLKRRIPDCMAGYIYLRDSENEWVLHVRMLPTAWNKEVIKLCSRWFGTRPLPQAVSRPLLRMPGLRSALWYRGERRPWRNRLIRVFSPNAYPMARLRKGETLLWEATCRIGPPLGAGLRPSEGWSQGESSCL